jgi:hypothetical protein
MIKINNKKFLLIFLLILSGLFLRAYNPELYVFGFDQVQILESAKEIISGNLTLIGPRTGPAGMFTGPLIYYLAAFLLLIISSPWTIVATSLTISLLTAVSLYLLVKKHLSEDQALIILLIWALSPFLIYFDRITWNPNLTLLSSALVFFPLISILKNKSLSTVDHLTIALGGFLGFQAHFSGFLLPALFIGTQLMWKKINLKATFFLLAGLGISLIPTFIFDMRHNWLNLRGLQDFLFHREVVEVSSVWQRLISLLDTTIKNIGKTAFFHLSREAIFFTGVLVPTFCLWHITKIKTASIPIKLSFSWLVLTIIGFSFYNQEIPEYYLFIHLPAIMYLFSCLLNTIFKNTLKISFFIFFTVLFCYLALNHAAIMSRDLFQIGNQLNLVNDIAKLNTKTPVAAIAYDFQPDVTQIGLRYLIAERLDKSEDGVVVHIAADIPHTKKYGHLGAWLDPRSKENTNYLMLNQLIIETPLAIELRESHLQLEEVDNHKIFNITIEGKQTSDFLIVVEETNYFSSKNWTAADFNSHQGYAKQFDQAALIYITTQQYDEIAKNLEEIKIYSTQPSLLF